MKRYRLIFFLLLAGFFLFRLWFMTTLPLSGDESYHWEWSRKPAFGYYDHPGLTAYIIRLSTWSFGRSTEFTARFPALLMLSGTAILCFFFAAFAVRRHGGTETEAGLAGFLAGFQVLVIPVFAFFSIYISTDPPLIFFWTLTLYLLYRAFHTESWFDWIGAGIAMGLAMLSKFLAFFMFPAVLIFVLLSPGNRKWLVRPHAYVAFACSLLVFSPFLWWNATHDWATFMFNFVYRQSKAGFAPMHVPEFVIGQALALSPGIFIFALSGMWRELREWRTRASSTYLFLALTSFVPLAYFLCVSFRRQVGLHWPASAWIGLIVYLACSRASRLGTKEEKGPLKKSGTVSFVLCAVMMASIHLLFHIPQHWVGNVCNALGLENARSIKMDTAERYGWPEMGKWVSGIHDKMVAGQGEHGKGVFVICGQYGVASGVAFYTPGHIRTHLWSKRRSHGENYRFWDDFTLFKGMDAVFVAKRESKAEGAVAKLEEHFRSVAALERLPVIVGGKEVRSFFVIRCYGFDGVSPEF